MSGREETVKAITEAYAMEKGMKEFYAYAASKSRGNTAGEIFGALRDMEDRHVRYFDFLYISLMEGRALLGYKEYTSKVTATHVESLRSLAPANKLFDPGEVTSSSDALKLALTIEDKASALYRQLAEKAVDGPVKAIFEEMAAQELKHIDYLRDLEKSL
jgi:rubrerythrin